MGRLIVVVLVLALAGCTSVDAHQGRRPVPDWGPAAPTVTTPAGAHAWAKLAGKSLIGSDNASTLRVSVESVIKVWLAADWLRMHGGRDRARLAAMLSYSDDQIAEDTYRALGADASIARMIRTCRMRSTRPVRFWWARTTVTAPDLAQLGACVADGRAAGTRWTPWLLATLRARHVHGGFGVVSARPGVAYMNGWTSYDTVWQVNCLAIGATWVLAVVNRYPARLGLAYGAGVCASVADQLAGSGRLPLTGGAPTTGR